MSPANFNILPYVSPELGVEEDSPPFDYCPGTRIRYYEPSDTVFSANFASWAAVGERVRFTAIWDFGDYETALAAAGYGGDFWANLASVTACISYQHPVQLPVCDESLPGVTISPYSDRAEVSADIRPPEEWAGKIYYISLVFHLIHNGQDDYVVVVFGISVATENLEAVTNDEPFFEPQWFKAGEPVTRLCIDEAPGIIELRAEHTKVGYAAIALLQRNGEIIAEWDGFDGGNLSKLTQGPFVGLTSAPSGGGQTETIYIDENGLIGDECVIIVVKKNGEITAPTECGDPGFEVEIALVLTKAIYFSLAVDWSIVPPLGADLLFIRFTWNMNGQQCTEVGSADTGTVNMSNCILAPFNPFDPFPDPPFYHLTFTVEVQLTTGCFYFESQSFYIVLGSEKEITYFA